jgi:hypothetical protein
MQNCPTKQGLPHSPQWAESLVVSTHPLPQQVSWSTQSSSQAPDSASHR